MDSQNKGYKVIGRHSKEHYKTGPSMSLICKECKKEGRTTTVWFQTFYAQT
jgi:hypothetical protein